MFLLLFVYSILLCENTHHFHRISFGRIHSLWINGTFASCGANNMNLSPNKNVRAQFGGEPTNGFSLNGSTKGGMFTIWQKSIYIEYNLPERYRFELLVASSRILADYYPFSFNQPESMKTAKSVWFASLSYINLSLLSSMFVYIKMLLLDGSSNTITTKSTYIKILICCAQEPAASQFFRAHANTHTIALFRPVRFFFYSLFFVLRLATPRALKLHYNSTVSSNESVYS